MKQIRRLLPGALAALLLALALAACSASTDPATGIGSTSATFNGHGACGSSDIGSPWKAWFEYRVKGSGPAGWQQTASTSGTCTDTNTISKSANVTGLAASTTYQYRVAATIGAVKKDASTPAMTRGAAGNQTHVTSASFSPPSNSVILLVVANGHDGTAPSSITDSLGAHLTYTLDKSARVSGSESAYAYLAQVGSTAPGSMTVTANFSTAKEGTGWDIQPIVLTGASATAAASNSQTWTANTTPSFQLTPQKTGSMVFAVGVDGFNTIVGTPGSGQASLSSGTSSTCGCAGWTQYRTATTTAGTAVTVNDTNSLPGGVLVGVEVAPSGQVGYSDSNGTTTSDGSDSNGLVYTEFTTSASTPAPPTNTAPPTISGSTTQGSTLTASPGTWTGSPTFAYQWQRCTTSCTDISGATGSSYTLVAADVGDAIDVKVTASNSGGSATATSARTATVTTSGSSWPASYTNGPLGANEVLPATQGHTLLTMWSGVAGLSESQQRTFMQQRITDMGRTPDIIGFACGGAMTPGTCGQDVSSTDLAENWIHSLGAIPWVANWDPGSKDYAAIAAGSYDSNIDSAAGRLKAFGHRIMLRLFEEFSLNAWNTTDFINAWRHVVTRMEADGATNVGFIWNPMEQAGGTRAQINASYPGDAYVDWVSSDDYNGDSNTGYNACVPGWNEFSWIFNYPANASQCGGSNYPSMEQQWGPEKPFFVAETGTKYDTANVPSGHTVDPNRKKNWYLNIVSTAAQMPYLIGVDFFDQDVTKFEPGNNWRVDSPCDSAGNHCTDGSTDANTYSGFKSMATSTQFSGGAAGGTQ